MVPILGFPLKLSFVILNSFFSSDSQTSITIHSLFVQSKTSSMSLPQNALSIPFGLVILFFGNLVIHIVSNSILLILVHLPFLQTQHIEPYCFLFLCCNLGHFYQCISNLIYHTYQYKRSNKTYETPFQYRQSLKCGPFP